MANVQANVPLNTVPFVDSNGYITEPWFIFLVQLFRRTGSGGGDDTSITLADVLSLEPTFSPSVISAGARSFRDEMVMGVPPTARALPEMVFAPVSGPSVVDQTFVSGTDFTPGTTSILTLKSQFTNAAQVWVFFDAAYQGDDQFSLSHNTLTFTSPIPVGTQNVYVKGLR